MTFRIAPIKPRNPLVALAKKRVAGPHKKSEGAARVAKKQALQRALKEEKEDH